MSEMKDANVAYGVKLAELGEKYENIVVIDADLAACSKTAPFREKYPERSFNVGIQECNMVGLGAGLASCGKIPFVNSFGMFTAGRAYDQIRNMACYTNLNVKVMGIYSGLSNGPDGPTHQCFEEFALMRAIPNMVVMCPVDANETEEMIEAAVKYEGPCFIRMGRGQVETVTDYSKNTFEIGKGVTMKDGNDVTIIATGNMVPIALKAADLLTKENINARIIDMHTIKPIDADLILKAAKETGAIVTSEEHNILAGLGGAVCEVISSSYPVPVIRHGIENKFGKSGDHDALMEKYGLTPEVLANKAKESIALKNK